jgi:KaiC/GvpD/RAD55 family RecA-like ATPase
VFKQLDDIGAKIRRGQVTLIGAAPGGGKSALATTLALYSQAPTVYFSADSDKATFGSRIMASALEIHLSEAEELLLTKNEEALAKLDRLTDHMWVNFDPSPSPKDIDEEIDCFTYIYGDYPHLVVVDNLMDVSLYGSDERMGHDAIIDFCRQLARRTGAAVLILCHVTGPYTDGTEVIPRSGLMNKIDKRPRLILTLHRYDINGLGVSVVKNSNGPAEADGSMMVVIPWLPEKSWFGRK